VSCVGGVGTTRARSSAATGFAGLTTRGICPDELFRALLEYLVDEARMVAQLEFGFSSS